LRLAVRRRSYWTGSLFPLWTVFSVVARTNRCLTQAFEQVAKELITLPELKANCHALGQLVERLPDLSSALQEVETAQEQEAEAEQALAALLATLARGTGQLEAEDADLAETMKQTGNLIQGIQFKLASIIVEEKRRQLEQYERSYRQRNQGTGGANRVSGAADKYRRCQHGAYGN